MSHDYSAILRQTALCAGLTDEEVDCIAAVCIWKQYEADEELFGEASHKTELYIICEGKIAIEVALPDRPHRKAERLATATDGMVIGELSLVDGSPRSARAYATTEAAALEIGSDAIRDIMESRPNIGYHIMKNLAMVLSARLRDTNLWLRNELLWSH